MRLKPKHITFFSIQIDIEKDPSADVANNAANLVTTTTNFIEHILSSTENCPMLLFFSARLTFKAFEGNLSPLAS